MTNLFLQPEPSLRPLRGIIHPQQNSSNLFLVMVY
jgi:hypothetical protein